MTINYPDAIAIAKSATELAIQQNFITACSSSEKTAMEIAKFYKTICEELASPAKE